MSEFWRYTDMFGRGSQSGPDFSQWIANELTAIRTGVDKTNNLVAAMQERVTNVKDDIHRIENRLENTEKVVSDLKSSNLRKDSSWLGVIKVAAALPVIAALMAIVNYAVNWGIVTIKGVQ